MVGCSHGMAEWRCHVVVCEPVRATVSVLHSGFARSRMACRLNLVKFTFCEAKVLAIRQSGRMNSPVTSVCLHRRTPMPSLRHRFSLGPVVSLVVLGVGIISGCAGSPPANATGGDAGASPASERSGSFAYARRWDAESTWATRSKLPRRVIGVSYCVLTRPRQRSQKGDRCCLRAMASRTPSQGTACSIPRRWQGTRRVR